MASTSERRKMTSDDRQKGEEKVERELDMEIPLMRQSSIYSLTLDEIQNTVCEPGKTFGSMNMDEFLANIWNVEEGQIAHAAGSEAQPNGEGAPPPPPPPPLQRQVSISIPAPLCRKTVDEVWTEIHRGRKVDHPQQHGSDGADPRQVTLGEMTLEDFLIKAGVVREGYHQVVAPSPHAPPPPPVTQYGVPTGYQMVGLEGAPVYGQVVGVQGYGDHQVAGNGMYEVFGDGGPGYSVGNGFGERVRNGYGGSSPGSEEGVGGGQVGKSGAAEGGGGGKLGRKRALDGAVEKVVERRQRRMIKNRESAARSRARKQAYTVELEAELKQLKEENVRLKEEERKMLALKKQVLMESMAERARVNAQKTVLMLRRCNSSPW
ncbi:bZIP transcription factor ABI5 homolog [Elaeis guineensis]|uniref:bZIP transcription factor ABI5 homolog n=1 Tax=Elaeis guineensis var. tenera TaxID=51953 RepID=UPI003C6CEAE9